MPRFILRKTSGSALSCQDAERLVCAAKNGRVLHRDNGNMLVELEESSVCDLRDSLPGWVICEEGEHIPVPDTRLKLRPDQT
jgi:hypothetical protein